MLLRTYRFRVPKKNERRMVAFMKREALPVLRRMPAIRAAFFLRSLEKKQEYMWVTLWTSEAARRRTAALPAWKALGQAEHKGGFFSGAPEARHFQVLLRC